MTLCLARLPKSLNSLFQRNNIIRNAVFIHVCYCLRNFVKVKQLKLIKANQQKPSQCTIKPGLARNVEMCHSLLTYHAGRAYTLFCFMKKMEYFLCLNALWTNVSHEVYCFSSIFKLEPGYICKFSEKIPQSGTNLDIRILVSFYWNGLNFYLTLRTVWSRFQVAKSRLNLKGLSVFLYLWRMNLANRFCQGSPVTSYWWWWCILSADTTSKVQTHTFCTTQVDKNAQNRTFFKGIRGWLTGLQILTYRTFCSGVGDPITRLQTHS